MSGGIIVQVLGELSNMGQDCQKFCQTFFLAEQPEGYYVLNDIFRFLKEDIEVEYDVEQEKSTPTYDNTATAKIAPPTPKPVEQPKKAASPIKNEKPKPSETSAPEPIPAPVAVPAKPSIVQKPIAAPATTPASAPIKVEQSKPATTPNGTVTPQTRATSPTKRAVEPPVAWSKVVSNTPDQKPIPVKAVANSAVQAPPKVAKKPLPEQDSFTESADGFKEITRRGPPHYRSNEGIFD